MGQLNVCLLFYSNFVPDISIAADKIINFELSSSIQQFLYKSLQNEIKVGVCDTIRGILQSIVLPKSSSKDTMHPPRNTSFPAAWIGGNRFPKYDIWITRVRFPTWSPMAICSVNHKHCDPCLFHLSMLQYSARSEPGHIYFSQSVQRPGIHMQPPSIDGKECTHAGNDSNDSNDNPSLRLTTSAAT